MGHDIFARCNRSYKSEEIAYLRRGGCNPESYKLEIYNALKATDFYAGCSGSGESKSFSKTEIKESYEFAINNKYDDNVVQFLCDCINYFNNNPKKRKIIITFS